MTLRVRYVGLDRIAGVVLPEDASIAVPDYLLGAAQERWPGRRVLPHHGLLPSQALPDLAILHKGLLDRVSRPVLRAILEAGRAVFASEDFLLVRPALRVAANALRPDWQAGGARLLAPAAAPLTAAPPQAPGPPLVPSPPRPRQNR